MKEQRQILVVLLELGKKNVAGVGEDVGRGDGQVQARQRRRRGGGPGVANGRFYGQKKIMCNRVLKHPAHIF
jgi:hypothetical protein